MKFNIDDYKGKYVMHCKTEEEAEIFCKYLHNIEHMWSSGDSYLSKNYWNDYKESTCYEFNTDSYCSKRYYEERRYTILEMEDFMSDTMSNKDRINKIFKLLGLSPDEVFKVEGFFDTNYKITQDLKVYMNVDRGRWIKSVYTIADFLNGNLAICKKPIPTKEEQIAIDYALACEYHWLAKDKDGRIYAYKGTPIKNDGNGVWDYDNGYSDCMLRIVLPISFLSWEDEVPYYIGD